MCMPDLHDFKPRNMKFTVTALEVLDKEKTGKVKLEAKHFDTYYTSQLYLYVPVADLPLYPFGREIELELPMSAVDKAIAEVTEVVDAVLTRQPTAAEQCGMTQSDYRQGEALYLHGDLSGK